MANKKIYEEQAKEIGLLYKDGYSTPMLARKFNVRHHTIRKALKRQYIQIRTISEAGKLASAKRRLFGQHVIPQSSKLLTEEKAYILGTMCGDGYLHKALE